MNDTLHELLENSLKYFAAPAAYWKWRDQGTALAWEEGPTITFRKELAIILARQQSQGLPPLAAVLIVLGACRESWQESRDALSGIIAKRSGQQRYLPDWIDELFSGLETLHALPRSMLSSPRAKAELIDYLFEGCDAALRTSASDAAAIVRLLESSPAAEWLEEPPHADFDLWPVLGLLREALSGFDQNAFELRLQTGFDRALLPAPLELTDGQRVRALLGQLQHDTQWCGLAMLARQLLAAVTLPRPLAEPDEMPLGGVSDISNRGTLDRLLISELAHDDLTLAVRVASSEALYLRRETPPRSPPQRRVVVLDSGLRMWGVPRLFATALGMALAAAGDETLRMETLRASGTRLVPVDLTDRKALLEHLGALETSAHPGAALHALKDLFADDSSPSDAVLITSDEAFEDPEFRGQLRAAGLGIAWVATVNRGGRMRLFALGVRECTLLREARLDLDTILAPTKEPRPALYTDDDLPAFCRVKPLPLYVPHGLTADRAWEVGEHGLLAISKDHRLTWWNDIHRGPKQLADNMPRGHLLWADCPIHGKFSRAVFGSLGPDSMHALWVNLETGAVNCKQLKKYNEEQPLSVCGSAAVIFVSYATHIVAFASNGTPIGRCEIPPDMLLICDRFYCHTETCAIHMVSFNGRQVTLTMLSGSLGVGDSDWLAMVRPARGSEEPRGFTRDGLLVNLSTSTSQTCVGLHEPPYQVAAVSRDGERIALQHGSKCSRVLDVISGETNIVDGKPHRAVDRRLYKKLKRSITNLRASFAGIYVNADGNLALLTRKSHEFVLESTVAEIKWRDNGLSNVPAERVHYFGDVTLAGGYLLRVAEWPGGSKAWLDSRGLLHLRGNNSELPELTLVLHEGATAAWTSDADGYGRSYFIPPETKTGTIEQFKEIMRRLVEELV